MGRAGRRAAARQAGRPTDAARDPEPASRERHSTGAVAQATPSVRGSRTTIAVSVDRSSRVAVDVVPHLAPARPQSRSLLAQGGAAAHGQGAIGHRDVRLRVRLEVQPPGGLAIGPAVHGHGHQVRAVLVVAQDRDPRPAAAAADGSEAHRSPSVRLRAPEPDSAEGDSVDRAMHDPCGPHEPARRDTRSLRRFGGHAANSTSVEGR